MQTLPKLRSSAKFFNNRYLRDKYCIISPGVGGGSVKMNLNTGSSIISYNIHLGCPQPNQSSIVHKKIEEKIGNAYISMLRMFWFIWIDFIQVMIHFDTTTLSITNSDKITKFERCNDKSSPKGYFRQKTEAD